MYMYAYVYTHKIHTKHTHTYTHVHIHIYNLRKYARKYLFELSIIQIASLDVAKNRFN